MLRTKRAYERPEKSDGTRVLVDGLWPRGLRKEAARVDLWLRDIAPSTGLRKWFGHDPGKWGEFKKKYFRELEEKEGLIEQIRQKRRSGTVTLVFGARDEEHNNAVALKEYLERKARP